MPQAKRCKNINGLNQIMIDIKPKRSLGEVYIDQKMDVTNFVNYIKKLKETEKITYFHAFSTMVGKVLYNRPLLNRYISNRHMYEHNDVTISYVMKVSFEDLSKEVMVVMPILEDDNIFNISKKIKEKVENVRSKNDSGTGANNAINILSKLPNILRVPIVGLLKLFDKYQILPSSLIKDNIYYSSIIISDIGSLHCDGIYHNITDFGTCSSLITIGEIKEVKENNKTKYYCDFGITMDERIADGFYFIKSIHLMQHILDNPKLLEDKVSSLIEIEK